MSPVRIVTRPSLVRLGLGFICLVMSWAAIARGQGPNHSASKFYPDSSDTAEALLRSASSHARDQQWSEAIEIYQRVIDQFGDKVAKLPREKGQPETPPEFLLFVDLRGFCQRSLAGLPPEARQIYRSRIDGQAEHWFRQGRSNRDPQPLRRVVQQAFCSSWGDDALELLGDLAFQEGRFGEALAMYRQLVLDRPDDRFGLIHPDPTVDLARIAAKKILCRAAAGEALDPRAEIEAFTARFPGAAGALAGRKGPYATILAESLGSDHLAPPTQPDGRWPTFAGSLTRTKVIPEPVDVGSLQWRVALERISPTRSTYGYRPMNFPAANPTNSAPERLLGYHPIVLGDQVIVADSTRVQAFNLNDRPGGPEGSPAIAIDPAWKHDPEGPAGPQVSRIPTGIPRYTLTAVGSRIYARMGPTSPPFYMGMRSQSSGPVSSIIALDWNAQGKLLWVQKASDLLLPNRPADRINRSVNFEGSPVADVRNVYVAVTDRREQTATYIACFDADTGASRWVRYLGAAASEDNNFMGMGIGTTAAGDYGHRLLSLDGPTIYFQTNLGALVALEADTGMIRWVATYPRQDSGRGQGSDRDLNPAILSDGLAIVAPTDASSIFAFDTGSGRLVWKTDPIADEVKLTHLLGVAKGRLVASGDRVLLFDVRTGRLLHTWPELGKSLEGYGRGLLAGDRIYWPTRNEIQVLDQRNGSRSGPPIKLLETFRTNGGNLVAGDGYLIVAQSDALVVFCQNSRLIDRYRDEIARAPAPEQAGTYYRLARAAEAVGRDDLALESYEAVRTRARPAETIDGVPLGDAARDHQFRLLTRLATESRRNRKFAQALSRLDTASKVARSDQDRLRARLLLADVQLEAGQPGEAVEIFQQLLTDNRIRPLTVSSDDGHRAIRADLFIADRLGATMKESGRKIYEPHDRRARELFERGRRDRDSRMLEELTRIYPVAEVVPEALHELGVLCELDQRPGPAAQAYKRLLSHSSSTDEARARALWRLAHVFEAQNYLVAARDTYLQVLSRYPRARIEEKGREQPLSDLVSAELSRPQFTQITADRQRPAVPVPLVRRWHRDVPVAHPIRALSAQGVTPAVDSARVFLVHGGSLEPLDPETGETRWSADLGASPTWVGYLSEKLITATSQGIQALDPITGLVIWRYGQAGAPRAPQNLDPFARNEPAPANGPGSSAPLHDFQLVGGRLFCLRGDQELIALDGETGFVDWSYSPRGSEINPRLWIGPERIVVQVLKPNTLLVLDTEKGHQLGRCALGEGELLERNPVPIDDDHVMLVPDRRTVKKFDLTRAQMTWDYRESAEMPVNGPPRVIVDAERLLVLHEGKLLIRLDPVTGARRWTTILGTEDLSERPESMAWDDRRFYCVTRQRLRAFSLDDGASLWSCHLTGPENAQWSVALADRSVLAYPSVSTLSEEELESLPVVVRRQETGALVQRFVFPASIADVRLRLDARGALVATSRSIWALGQRPALAANPNPVLP